MLWIIGFFTVVLVLDSLFLILLVLVQLPKKEAGLGQAFGSSATDALFGAGSGNALTKMTKYSTGIFFVLTLAIYIMYNHQARSRSGAFATKVQQVRDVDLPAPKTPPPVNTNLATNVAGMPKVGEKAEKETTIVPDTTNSKTPGLLTVPQAAPSGTPPAAESTPKPAPAK